MVCVGDMIDETVDVGVVRVNTDGSNIDLAGTVSAPSVDDILLTLSIPVTLRAA